MKDEVKAILKKIKYSTPVKFFETEFKRIDVGNNYEIERNLLCKAINEQYDKKIQGSKELQETIRSLAQEFKNIPERDAVETLIYLAYMLHPEQELQIDETTVSKSAVSLQKVPDKQPPEVNIEKKDIAQQDEKITKEVSEGPIGSCQEVAEIRKEENPLDIDNRIISDFNNWASNLNSTLPSDFYYVSGDIRIRTTQTIIESASETKWISNRYRSGSKKYLFPNPKTFDQMTDISKLYKMDQAKLKAKGQNSIKVTKPCEIADNGYINYPGELELL